MLHDQMLHPAVVHGSTRWSQEGRPPVRRLGDPLDCTWLVAATRDQSTVIIEMQIQIGPLEPGTRQCTNHNVDNGAGAGGLGGLGIFGERWFVRQG